MINLALYKGPIFFVLIEQWNFILIFIPLPNTHDGKLISSTSSHFYILSTFFILPLFHPIKLSIQQYSCTLLKFHTWAIYDSVLNLLCASGWALNNFYFSTLFESNYFFLFFIKSLIILHSSLLLFVSFHYDLLLNFFLLFISGCWPPTIHKYFLWCFLQLFHCYWRVSLAIMRSFVSQILPQMRFYFSTMMFLNNFIYFLFFLNHGRGRMWGISNHIG